MRGGVQPAGGRAEIGFGVEIDAGFNRVGTEIPEEEDGNAGGVGDVARAGVGAQDGVEAPEEAGQRAEAEVAGNDVGLEMEVTVDAGEERFVRCRAAEDDVEVRRGAEGEKRVAEICQRPDAGGLAGGHEAGKQAPVPGEAEPVPELRGSGFVVRGSVNDGTQGPIRRLACEGGNVIAKIGGIGTGMGDGNGTGDPGGESFIDVTGAIRDAEAQGEKEVGPILDAIGA